MSESFHDLNYICLFILGIQNLCRKDFESIFTKELVFDLDVKHVFHGVKFVWIQTSNWLKLAGLIKPFCVSFRLMLYLTLSLSKTITLCWLMRLFLSNSGNLKSCIMTTLCVLRWPVRVLTSLVSPSNLITPLGKADLLTIETFEPESKKSFTLHSNNVWVPFNFV